MRVLFDQGVPVPLRMYFSVDVETCYERGWSDLANGKLIEAAESEFEVLVTTDKNLRYQQNLVERQLAVLVLPTPRWPTLLPFASLIAREAESLLPKAFVEWTPPTDPDS
ncbi:MAG: hypothetical protein ACFB21_03505 [Opitutales bacterium]